MDTGCGDRLSLWHRIYNKGVTAVKKIYVLILSILLSFSLCCIPAAAQSASLSLSVSGTLRAGRTFTVALSSDAPLYAIQLDIDYDGSRVEFKSVKSDSNIRYRQSKGRVSTLISGSEAKSGILLTATFKALADGETKIAFTPLSAADSAQQLIDFDTALTLNLSLGDNASYRTDVTPKEESPTQISPTRPIPDSRSTGDESRSQMIPDEYRSKTPVMRILLISLGSALLVGAVLFIGILIGRRSKKKEPPDPSDADTDPNKKAEP